LKFGPWSRHATTSQRPGLVRQGQVSWADNLTRVIGPNPTSAVRPSQFRSLRPTGQSERSRFLDSSSRLRGLLAGICGIRHPNTGVSQASPILRHVTGQNRQSACLPPDKRPSPLINIKVATHHGSSAIEQKSRAILSFPFYQPARPHICVVTCAEAIFRCQTSWREAPKYQGLVLTEPPGRKTPQFTQGLSSHNH
jgi:hypothetical protein